MFKAPSRIVFERERARELEIHQQQLSRVRCVIDHSNSYLESAALIRQRHLHRAISKQEELNRQNQMFVKKLQEVQPTMRTTHLSPVGNSFFQAQSQQMQQHHRRDKSEQIMLQDTGNFNPENTNLNESSTPLQMNSTMHAQSQLLQSQQLQAWPSSAKFFSTQRKIEAENIQRKMRLSQTKSVFDNSKWAAEAKEHQKILQTHTLFPNNTKRNPTTTGRSRAKNSKKSVGQSLQLQTSINFNSSDMNSSQITGGITSGSLAAYTTGGTGVNSLDLQPFQNKILAFTTQQLNQSYLPSQQQSLQNSSKENNNGNSILYDSSSIINTSKLPPMNSLQLPSAFFSTLSNDAQRSNFLKGIFRKAKTVLFRKPALIQDEKFFVEVKLEANQFKIELENALGEVFTLSIAEEQGMQYLRRDCNDEFEVLFQRLRLNRNDKTISLIQKSLLNTNNPQVLLQLSKSRQFLQHRKQSITSRNSQQQLPSLDENDPPIEKQVPAKKQQKQKLEPEGQNTKEERQKRISKSSNQQQHNISSSISQQNLRQTKKQQKQNVELSEQTSPRVVVDSKQQIKQQSTQQSKQNSKQKEEIHPSGKDQGQSKVMIIPGNKQTQQQQQQPKKILVEKSSQQQKNNSKVSQVVKKPDQAKAKKETEQGEVDLGWDEYNEDEFEQFDKEEEGGQNKSNNHQKNNQTNQNNNNSEDDSHKMSSFTFKNNNSFKANSLAPNSKQEQSKLHSDPKQKQGKTNEKDGLKDKKKSDGNNTKKEEVQVIASKKQVEKEEEEEYGDEDIEYEKEEEEAAVGNQEIYDGDEFYEEDSGTQYEINDEDKKIIEEKEKQKQSSKQVEKIDKTNKGKQDEEEEEEYDADFD